MTKRIAAIDIGTNSTKTTIADVDGGVAVLSEDSEITRLGEGVDASGALNSAAMDRTLAAIRRFADAARAQGAVHIAAAGTSALRDASNGAEFIARVHRETGVSIEIITGDREAELAYAAVHSDSSLRLDEGDSLLAFDIGGGSTELILGEGAAIRAHRSLDIGAVRLTERFLRGDPPSLSELDQASKYVDDLLRSFALTPSPGAVAGIGGTAVNVASVAAHQSGEASSDLHGRAVTFSEVEGALARFVSCNTQERKGIAGLESARADVIVAGVVILRQLLLHAAADRFVVSLRGMRYGLIAEGARESAD